MCSREPPYATAGGVRRVVGLAKESKLLAKHSLIYAAGIFLNRIAAFLLLPLYTKYLTPHDYGVKELIGLTTEVISILLATSIASAIYRFYFEHDTEEARGKVMSTALVSVGSIGLVVLGGMALFAGDIAELVLDSSAYSHYFLVAFGSVWFQAFNNMGYNYLRAEKKSLVFILVSLGQLVAAIAMNIYTIVVLELGVFGILLTTLLTSCATSIILVIPMLRRFGVRFSYPLLREMLAFGLPLVPSQFGGFVVHLSDRFFIKAYCTVADAGLYSLGYRFGVLPSYFVSAPFNQVWQPRRFELFKQENSEVLFGRIFTYFLVLMVGAGLGVSVLTKELIQIIAEPKFWDAYGIVPLIVLGTMIFSLHNHFNVGLLIHKKTKIIAVINLSNAVFVTVLNFFLIRRYGMYGAAYATVLAFVYKVSLTYLWSRKYYEIHFEWSRVARVFLVALTVFLAAYRLPDLGSPYVMFAAKSALLLLYPLGLVLLRFFTQEEKAKCRALLQSRLGRSSA